MPRTDRIQRRILAALHVAVGSMTHTELRGAMDRTITAAEFDEAAAALISRGLVTVQREVASRKTSRSETQRILATVYRLTIEGWTAE